MPVFDPVSLLNRDEICRGGSAEMTLGFTAGPGCRKKAVELVLMMDRSFSMYQTPLCRMQCAAMRIIDRLSVERGGRLLPQVRMGLVSFDGGACMDCPLTDQGPVLKASVKLLKAGGSSQCLKGLELVQSMLRPAAGVRRILVMMTDGKCSQRGIDERILSMKESGLEVYVIGTEDMPMEKACTWASNPKKAHVVTAVNGEALEKAADSMAPEAEEWGTLEIRHKLTEDFVLGTIEKPSWGSAEQLDCRTILWRGSLFGIKSREKIRLKFQIHHNSDRTGCLPVSACTCSPHLKFPCPVLQVKKCSCPCTEPKCSCPCTGPQCSWLDSCGDCSCIHWGRVPMKDLGRILYVDAVVPNVCPGKRVAVGIILTEVDAGGCSHPRGMKTILLPAYHGEVCRDIPLTCIPFVVPEALRSPCCEGLCSPRKFCVQILANYVDTDVICCSRE